MTWTALDDPRYRVLAMRSAAIMGTADTGIINAIIAHWRCEIGSRDVYPPVRNNPGDVAEDAAKDVKATYTVDTPNPQPGNPIVTFATPEAGADAYGHVINDLPRYAAVRAAVTAKDPTAYMKAVAAAGYGTGYACLVDVYRDPRDSPPPASLATPPPTGTFWWADAHSLAQLFKPDSHGVLRPVIGPYTFVAWMGHGTYKTYAPKPTGAASPTKSVFRQVLSGSHHGYWVRKTDSGVIWHPI